MIDSKQIKDEKLAQLYEAFVSGNTSDLFNQVLSQLTAANELMKKTIIAGKPVTSWSEYESHLSVFLALNAKTIHDEKLLSALKLKEEEVKEHYVSKARTGDFTPTGLIADLIQKANEIGTWGMQRALYYTHEDIERFKKTLLIHDRVNNDLPNQRNPTVRRYLLLNLGRDAFELYLIVLNELYEKIHDRPKANNKELYDFFRQHPPIYNYNYHNLRNDVSHISFDEREQYTNEELHRLSNLLLVKTFIGMIAKNMHVIEDHRQRTEKIKEFLANFSSAHPNKPV